MPEENSLLTDQPQTGTIRPQSESSSVNTLYTQCTVHVLCTHCTHIGHTVHTGHCIHTPDTRTRLNSRLAVARKVSRDTLWFISECLLSQVQGRTLNIPSPSTCTPVLLFQSEVKVFTLSGSHQQCQSHLCDSFSGSYCTSLKLRVEKTHTHTRTHI